MQRSGLRATLLATLAVLLLGPPAGAAEIPLDRAGGIFTVPVRLNGVMDLDFVVDTGASEVTIPAPVAEALVRSGTASRDDLLSHATYMLADGSTVEHPRLNLRIVQVGGLTLRNVPASVGGADSVPLLGQNLLERLGPWTLDSRRGVMIVDPQVVAREALLEQAGDPRVARNLRELGLPYQVDPDNDFVLVVAVEEGRTQLLFVNSATRVEAGEEVREVWSPAFEVARPELPEEVHFLAERIQSGSQWGRLGTWREVPVGESSFAIYSATVAADSPPEALQEALRCVSAMADAMEQNLTGGDKF